MIANYFTIPYSKAVEFLTGLSEDKKQKICEQFNITEPVINNGIEYSQEEQIAEFITDDELLELGYVDNDNSSDNNLNCLSSDDIITLLTENLTEDEISDLLHEYEAKDIEELSLVILDEVVEEILDTILIPENKKKDYAEVIIRESNNILKDYNENYDFLEEIPSDCCYYLMDPDNDPYLFGFDNEADYLYFTECLDNRLVSECIPMPEKTVDGNFVVEIRPIFYKIDEDVVINSELNPILFNKDHKLKDDVYNQLLDYVYNFINNNEDIDVNYSDIVLTGSNAGYLYKPNSDIDIHFVSTEPLDEVTFDNLRNKFKLYQTEDPLIIGDNHNVELNIEDGYNMIMNNRNPRRYSLLDNDWVNNSDQNEQYTESDLNSVDGYKNIVKSYEEKIDDIINSDEYANAIALKQELRKNRSDDLANFGALSMGNVVFKELRESGYYGKLRNYIKSKEVKLNNDEE